MGILPAIPVCGGFPLLADSRHSSHLLHQQKPQQQQHSNMSFQGRLGILYVYLTIAMQATAESQGKKPHQIECHCPFLLVACLLIPWRLSKDPAGFPRSLWEWVRKHITVSSLITSGLPAWSLVHCWNSQGTFNIWKIGACRRRVLQSIGIARAGKQGGGECLLGLEWERRILGMLGTWKGKAALQWSHKLQAKHSSALLSL